MKRLWEEEFDVKNLMVRSMSLKLDQIGFDSTYIHPSIHNVEMMMMTKQDFILDRSMTGMGVK